MSPSIVGQSGQSFWNNRKDLPRGCKVDRPTSGKVPGSGSRVFPHLMPTPPRPASPPTLRSRAPGLSMGLLYYLAPPRCDLPRGGEGNVPPTAASAPSLSSNQFQTPVYSPGAGDFSPTPHTGLSLGARNPLPTLQLRRHP